MDELYEMSHYNTKPVILCGDFNSEPNSAVYHGITTGKSNNVFDEKTKSPLQTPATFTDSPYKSCYKSILNKEPEYSTFTVDFKSVLDYIFVNTQVKIKSVLEDVDTKYFETYKSFPNKDFPSDHIMLAADLKF